MSSLAAMRRATTCVLAAVALIAAGCGDESSDSRPATVSVSAPTSSTTTARDEPTAPVAVKHQCVLGAQLRQRGEHLQRHRFVGHSDCLSAHTGGVE